MALAEVSEETVGSCRILSHVEGHDRYSHLQNLTPQIRQVLEEAGSSIDDVSAIAVSHGPGSFTGIRIGVTAARTFAQMKDIPCIAVSSLEGMAERVKDELRPERKRRKTTDTKQEQGKSEDVLAVERELMTLTGTRVNITGDSKGKLEFEYYSIEELNRLIDIIREAFR